jgi:hypothetical protein
MSLTCLTIYNIDNTDDKSRVQLTFLYVLFTVTFFTDVTTLDVDDVLQVHDEHEADDNVDENKIDIYPMEMNVIVTNVDEVSELQFNVLDNSTNNENGFDAKSDDIKFDDGPKVANVTGNVNNDGAKDDDDSKDANVNGDVNNDDSNNGNAKDGKLKINDDFEVHENKSAGGVEETCQAHYVIDQRRIKLGKPKGGKWKSSSDFWNYQVKWLIEVASSEVVSSDDVSFSSLLCSQTMLIPSHQKVHNNAADVSLWSFQQSTTTTPVFLHLLAALCVLLYLCSTSLVGLPICVGQSFSLFIYVDSDEFILESLEQLLLRTLSEK